MSRSLVFARRRARFFDGMKEGVALLFATPEVAYSHDVHYRYRPDPDLFYLTGFTEPEAAAVLDADLRTFTLFVRPKDRSKETWEGRRSGPEGAVRDHGADRAYPFGDLSKRLPDLVRRAHVLHYVFGAHAEGDRIVASLLARFRRETRNPKRGPATVVDPTDLLHAMRLVKAPEEIVLMERSAAIAVAAHREARRLAKPGLFEYQLEAAIDSRFRAMGASGPAYPTIVASGENATILHYTENRRRIGAGDLVLVDAGFGPLHAAREAALRRGLLGPAGRHRGRQARHALGCAARGGARGASRRAPRGRDSARAARGAEEEERRPALRAASHVALARPRRPRPGPLSRRGGRSEEAGARHGAHDRARPLRACRREARSEGVPRARHPPRGRRPRDRSGRKRPDGVGAEVTHLSGSSAGSAQTSFLSSVAIPPRFSSSARAEKRMCPVTPGCARVRRICSAISPAGQPLPSSPTWNAARPGQRKLPTMFCPAHHASSAGKLCSLWSIGQ